MCFVLYGPVSIFVGLVLTCFPRIILLEILGEGGGGGDVKPTKKDTYAIEWRKKPLSFSLGWEGARDADRTQTA